MNLREKQANIIKEFRNETGITQEEMAFRSGVSVDSIRHIETGRTLPNTETVFKLAHGLGIEAMEIYAPLWEYWKNQRR